MRRVVIEQCPLIAREPEEVILLANPLRLRAVNRTHTLDEILFLLEGLARHAVPALVLPLVHVAAGTAGLDQSLDAGAVARLGRPDEVVEGHRQAGPHVAEDGLHPVAVRQRILTQLTRTLEDVLRVLVVAHDEPRLDASQPLVAGNHVSRHLLVRGAEMRPAVHVVDRGGQIERHVWVTGQPGLHGRRLHILHGDPVLPGRPHAVVELGRGVHDRALPPGHLEPDRAKPCLDRHDLSIQALALDVVVPDAEGGRLAEDDSRQCLLPIGRRQDCDQGAGPVLLHLDRGEIHLERAGRVEAIHQNAEDLRVHVVDLALDHDDALGGRAIRALPHQHAEHVGCLPELTGARPVPDPVDPHDRQRPECGGVARQQQRACRREELGLRAARVDRRVAQQPHGCGRWHREDAVCRLHHPRAHVDGRHHDPLGAEPLDGEHRADDVDD